MVGTKRSGRAAIVALTVAVGAGCVKNPATGKRHLNLVGKDQEVAMGRQGAEDVAASIGLYGDDALTQYVSQVGQKLAATSERNELPWTFRVVDDASVNAFALPGGYIFVTRGLLAFMQNEAQLATVLGHEIGHVTAEHSVNQLSKQELAQIGLGVGMMVSDTVRALGQVGLQGLQLLFLKFSRDDEREADELGVRYALRAGYDVREMPKVFEVLERVSEQANAAGGGRLPVWMATHPEPAERVKNANARLAKLPPEQLANLTVNEAGYLRHVDGVVLGANPREGFFQGDRYYHPELKFSLTLPAGWKKQNLRQAVIAVSPQQDALVQLTAAAKNVAPEDALSQFFSQRGVRQVAPARKVDGSGLGAQFNAQTDDGELGGFVAFFAHGGTTYQLVSAAKPENAPVYAAAFEQCANSFSNVTDERILAVQPVRVQVQQSDATAPLTALAKAQPAPVPVEQLALMNQIQPTTVVKQGETIKWAVGGGPNAVDLGMSR
jgi:predicted Zn-dependent protease